VGKSLHGQSIARLDAVVQWNLWGTFTTKKDTRGLGIAQWLECQTRGWKVAGMNPCSAVGEFSYPRLTFCADSLFQYLFHPCVTAVDIKDPGHSARKKCRWQVTAVHACTLCMWLCMKWHGAWLYRVHRMRWDSSSFMWHQPCQAVL